MFCRRLILAFGVAAAALAALAGSSAPAAEAAGALYVYGGTLPDGTIVPAGPWQGLNDGALTGGSFGVAMPPNTPVGWRQTATMSPPLGTTFGGLWILRTADAPTSIGGAQPYISTAFDDASAGQSLSGGIAMPAVPMLSIAVSCIDPGSAPPSARCSAGAYWRASRMRYQLNDAVAPTATLESGGGNLLNGSWATGPTSLSFNAADQGGGVYRAFVREGATTYYTAADPNGTNCRGVAGEPMLAGNQFAATVDSLIPCRTSSRLYRPTFDVAEWGDGTHSGLTLGIEDAAGNETILSTNRTVRVNAPGGALPDLGAAGPGGCVYAVDGTACVALTAVTDPVVSGSTQEGGTLLVTGGSWTVNGLPLAYTWERCPASGPASGCTTIAGAHSSSYVLTDQDAGHTMRATVTASGAATSATARSAVSPVVRGAASGSTGSGGGGAGGGAPTAATKTAPDASGASLPSPDPETNELTVFTPVAVNGVNGSTQAALSVRFARTAARTINSTYAAAHALMGTLTTPDGFPITGATLRVDQIPDAAGAAARSVAIVRTDKNGRYTTTTGVGPSRQIRVSYQANPANPQIVSATVRVHVRAVVTLRIRPAAVPVNRNMTITGRLKYLRQSRVQLRIEALDGRTWRSFAFVKTVKSGRFIYHYRFKPGAEGRRFYFRVYVDSPVYPFEPAPSRVLGVSVR